MKNAIIKVALIPVLFALACLCAGLYGAIHNQISYTVAPEFFTVFKFRQFGIDRSLPERMGAAVVGWRAAWWMGPIIGAILIPLGLFIPGYRQYFFGMLRVFRIVAITALAAGLAALLVSFVTMDAGEIGEVTRYGLEIRNDLRFARAAKMHDFSYIGGLVGIATGSAAVFWQRRKARKFLAAVQNQPEQ